MTDSSSPLTEQALTRLRALASGNGLEDEEIVLVESEEKNYPLDAVVELVPESEIEQRSYFGTVQTKDAVMCDSFTALQQEVEKRRKELQTDPSWIPEAIEELKKSSGQGWGLDGAKVVLPERSVLLAATEACPSCQGRRMLTCGQCQGNKSVVCPQCAGNRQEVCYNCNGRGENPAQPGQICVICNGRRYVPCRFCRATGQLSCPTCHGKGGTPCGECRGLGQMTQEVKITCAAVTRFKLKADGMPSGLRRGLDRLGIANLVRGHADIEIADTPPVSDEEREKRQPREPPPPPKPEVHYRARLPYADLKVRFGTHARVVLIGAFGKRCALMNVPPFLDETLKPWREQLQRAVAGEAVLEFALEARVMLEALYLILHHRGTAQELRRVYTVGLSVKTAEEILGGIRETLRLMTLSTRTITAISCGVVSAILLAVFLLSPLNAHITREWTWVAGLMFDLSVLSVLLAIDIGILSYVVQITLQRRFPALEIPMQRHTGKTGYVMLGAVVVGFVTFLLLSGQKPLWLLHLLH